MTTSDATTQQSRLHLASRYSGRGLAVCLSFALAACSTPAVKDEAVEELEVATPAEVPLPATAVALPNVRFAAVGDIMLGTDYPHERLPPANASLLTPVADILSRADITFGNLEGVLQDGGEPAKQCSNPSRCYLFRTPASYARHLSAAGFDVMSLANNHARDFGEEGRDSSMLNLRQEGIVHTGREGDVASLSVNGVKVGVIAFAPYYGSNNMLAAAEAESRVRLLDEEHDLVVVSFHGGAEGSGTERLPFARESYYGEDRGDVVAFARMVVDAGADLVLGHGPHVPRAVELYRERLIAYSLGNFATYWGIRITGNNGLAPILEAELDAEGRFVAGGIVSARQVRPDGTVIDEEHRAAALVAELTRLDFPDTPLEIDERGQIRRTNPAIASGAPPASPVIGMSPAPSQPH